MFSPLFRTFGEQKRIAARIAKYQQSLHELDLMLMRYLASLSASAQALITHKDNNLTQQIDTLNQLRIVTLHTGLRDLLIEFSDLMCIKRKSAGIYYLPHAEHINAVFYQITRLIQPNEVLNAVKIMAHQQNVLHLSASFYRGQNNDLFAQGISVLAAKCPVIHQAQFYTIMEQTGYLAQTFGHANCQYKAQFLCDTFDGAPLPDVMELLSASPLWRAQNKTNALRQAIKEQDERLLPALDM